MNDSERQHLHHVKCLLAITFLLLCHRTSAFAHIAAEDHVFEWRLLLYGVEIVCEVGSLVVTVVSTLLPSSVTGRSSPVCHGKTNEDADVEHLQGDMNCIEDFVSEELNIGISNASVIADRAQHCIKVTIYASQEIKLMHGSR